MMITPIRIALALALALLMTASPALASTINVSDDCAGVTAPCTTDLQAALDDTGYSTIQLTAGAALAGDYMIDRSLTLRGAAGSRVSATAGVALRVDRTNNVLVETLDIVGAIVINDSVDVLLDQLDVSGGDYGVHVVDSSDIEVRDSTVDGNDRAIDLLDSTAVLVAGGGVTSSGYGVVGSSARVVVDDTDIYGAINAVVLQDGHNSTLPKIVNYGATFTADPGQAEAWVWDRARRIWNGASAAESVDPVGDMVSLISVTPWGGD